jgi:hypothetical protein
MDEDLLPYLNDALIELWGQLKDGNDEVIGEIELTQATTDKPADYHQSLGLYPITTDKMSIIVYGSLPLKVRYVKRPVAVTLDSTIPYSKLSHLQLLENITAALALNRNGYNVQAESAAAAEMTKNIE